MTGAAPDPGRSSTGLDQNFAAALAYVGGALTGIVFLMVEKQSRFVRFHAMQSTITFLGVLVLHIVVTAVPLVGRVLRPAFLIGVVALWLVLLFKAVSGQLFKLPYIGDLAEEQLRGD